MKQDSSTREEGELNKSEKAERKRKKKSIIPRKKNINIISLLTTQRTSLAKKKKRRESTYSCSFLLTIKSSQLSQRTSQTPHKKFVQDICPK